MIDLMFNKLKYLQKMLELTRRIGMLFVSDMLVFAMRAAVKLKDKQGVWLIVFGVI